MTYNQLQDMREIVNNFKADKLIYDPRDILAKMRDRLFEEMVLMGYQSLLAKGKTVDELFIEKLRESLTDVERLDQGGEIYIRFKDLSAALSKLRE